MRIVKKKRLALILLMITGISIATFFGLRAFNDNLMYFFSATDVVEGKAPKDHLFRLGGMVVKGSVVRQPSGLTVQFVLTDMAKEVTVQYTGILPDLFREGQGIIATGKMEHGTLKATTLLAKHDEKYIPRELYKAAIDQDTCKNN